MATSLTITINDDTKVPFVREAVGDALGLNPPGTLASPAQVEAWIKARLFEVTKAYFDRKDERTKLTEANALITARRNEAWA